MSSSPSRLRPYFCFFGRKVIPHLRQYQLFILGVFCFIFFFVGQCLLPNSDSFSFTVPKTSTTRTTAVTTLSKYDHHNVTTKKETRAPTTMIPLADNETKYILLYTTLWHSKEFNFGLGRQSFLDYNCPVNNCILHSKLDDIHGDKTLSNMNENNLLLQPFHNNYSKYHAVLFSVIAPDGFDLRREKFSISTWRKPHQRFVFLAGESQAWPIISLRDMDGFFNWTATFRWKSDILRPYGWFQPKTTTTNGNITPPPPPNVWMPKYNETEFYQSLPFREDSFRALARRPGKVAWIVSHCNTKSKREDYVYELQKHISVDIFGKCKGGEISRLSFNSSCNKFTMDEEDDCSLHVQTHYKFYLAFENTFCNDYVTEKFFRRINHSVVITLGQANYSQIAPPHSYIDIFDFDSPKSLAQYLHALDQDDNKYLSYFWWKDHYDVVWRYEREEGQDVGRGNSLELGRNPCRKGFRSFFKFCQGNTPSTSPKTITKGIFGQAFCRLCERLHEPNVPHKVYDDIYQWWIGEGNCGTRFRDLQDRMARSDASLP